MLESWNAMRWESAAPDRDAMVTRTAARANRASKRANDARHTAARAARANR